MSDFPCVDCVSATANGAHRDLTPLFDPRSIAVVGASADATKWGGDIAARLVRNEKRRDIYLVNRKGGVICGRRAYRSLSELPSAPDMVMLAVPAAAFEATLEEALGLGTRAFVAVFAGLGEAGAEGKAREVAAVQRIREAGALMIGPNCMGAADTSVAFQGVANLDIPVGSVGFISQSGAMGEEFTMRSQAANSGFSRFVTLGNQADVSIAQILWSYRDHEPTRVIAIYAEELKDGRELACAAAATVAAGKPVLLLTPGRSEASARAAHSHTGSLAPDSAVLDAVCAASGMVLVDTPAALFETTLGFLHTTSLVPGGRLPAGRRLGIVTEGGGHGGNAADCAAAAGLTVPLLGEKTMTEVRAAHEESAGSNPIDFAIGTTDPDAYARVVPALASSGEIDALLAVGQLGYWAARFAEFEDQVEAENKSARSMARAARTAGIPLVVATVYPDTSPAETLRAEGVPVYREIASATSVLGRLADHASRVPTGVPALPLPAPPLAPPANGSAGPLDYWSARGALSASGIDFVAARLVETATADELAGKAAQVAAELHFPVAVKALGLLHKSDEGGVALGLNSEAAVIRAVADMVGRLRISALTVERMAPIQDGLELIVGAKRDPRFGPVLLVGIGGLYAELLADVRTALAPIDEQVAEQLLKALRGAPLLLGARGRPQLDIGAAARAATALSCFAAAHPEVAEAEVNPLLVMTNGALALDARVILN